MEITKKSCWNCYNIFEEVKGFKDKMRIFCTEDCYNNYKRANSVILIIIIERKLI